MRRLVDPREEHFASGFASDDEVPCGPRRGGPRRFGALEGDEPPPARSALESMLYSVRQGAAGPSRRKVRYLDALRVGEDVKPSPAQTRPRGAYGTHCALLGLVALARQRKAAGEAPKTDLDCLRERHRFLRDAADDDGSWEARLAQRYYERLFKEYVICDLAGYKKGNIGLRWRTETEVLQGKGQFRCGHRRCESRAGLRSYEVDFKYKEAGERKRALVKARLCEACAYKLHYRRLRAHQRRRRRELLLEGTAGPPALKRVKLEEDAASVAPEAPGIEDSDEANEAAPAAAAAAAGAGSEAGDRMPTEEERRLLEALAWKGPDPETRTREDDFDDYLDSLFM